MTIHKLVPNSDYSENLRFLYPIEVNDNQILTKTYGYVFQDDLLRVFQYNSTKKLSSLEKEISGTKHYCKFRYLSEKTSFGQTTYLIDSLEIIN